MALFTSAVTNPGLLCQLGEAGIRIPGPESSQQQPAQADLATIKESLVTVHRDPQVSSSL